MREYQHSNDASKEKEDKQKEVASGKKKKPKKTPPITLADMAIDVLKLDIWVGIINKAWEHPEADTLFCKEIVLGKENGPHQIEGGQGRFEGRTTALQEGKETVGISYIEKQQAVSKCFSFFGPLGTRNCSQFFTSHTNMRTKQVS